MSKNGWTPGPWDTHRARTPVDGEFDWCVAAAIDGKPHVIVEAFGRVAENVRPNAQANARLIAAAPELAEALDDLLMALNLPGDHCELEPAKERARIAISKARGETQ